eukprot:7509416-Pyramimonas_sp.AAC.1
MPQGAAGMEAGATQTIELPPHARLVIPRYSVEDVCAMFGQFLQREGFTRTSDVLAKELEVKRRTPGEDR